MKKCPHCQNENPVHANFCNYCGKKLNQAESTDKPFSVRPNQSKKKSAERRQLTILFCDLVGSTPLSQRLDPEDFRQVILDYHQIAEDVIGRFGGHVGNYLGDGLLIYFGYPEGLEDAPKAGIQAAINILNALKNANKDWKDVGKSQVDIRIGIHTGLVVVDEHLALGETVNIAARLEGLAPTNGIVISPQTLSLVKGWFDVKSIGLRTLKGISAPMELFQVIQESGVKTRLDIAKGKGLSPLVGRKKELQLIMTCWDQAKNGQGNLVLLNGEAGIGKSRLVDSVQQELSQDSKMHLLEARCSAYHRTSPFNPLIELFENDILQFNLKEDTATREIKLEHFFAQDDLDKEATISLFAEFLNIPSQKFPALIKSPGAKKQRLLEKITEVLLKMSTGYPVLLILEDLHWADASTLEWLNLIRESVRTQSILLLCTTRPAFRPEWADSPGHTRVNLERLSFEDLAEICLHQTNGKALPQEMLEQIASKTEGVPLFVEELTKMVLESGFMIEEGESYEMVGAIDNLAIPSTLRDSLMARLDRLSYVKEIVQVGSVLGREFSFDLLSAVLIQKMDRDKLEQSLKRLLEAEIFYLKSNDQERVYQFKHALIQDAAYDSLLRIRRQTLHQQIAEVLKSKFSDSIQSQPELLAHHYTEGGQPLEAIPLWLQAGQKASQKHANAEAVVHLNSGLGLLSHIKNEEERKILELDFLLILGGVSIIHYGYPHPKVGEAFNRAKEIAHTIAANQKLGFILANLQSYYFNKEDYKTLDQLITYGLKLSEEIDNGYLFRIGSKIAMGYSNVIRGDFKTAHRELQNAIALYNPDIKIPLELTPAGEFKIAANAWLMLCLHIRGFMAQAQSIAELHWSIRDQYDDARCLYHIYTFIALTFLEEREWKKAEEVLDKYLPIAKEFGDPIFTLTAEVYYYVALAIQGDKDAFGKAIQFINVCYDVGFKAFAVSMSPYIGELYYLHGEYESSISWIDKIMNHVDETGSHIHTAELYRIKGLSLQKLGKSEAIVEEQFDKALEWSQKQSARTYELRAAKEKVKLYHNRSNSNKAYLHLKEVYDWFTEGLDSVDLREAQELLLKSEPMNSEHP